MLTLHGSSRHPLWCWAVLAQSVPMLTLAGLPDTLFGAGVPWHQPCHSSSSPMLGNSSSSLAGKLPKERGAVRCKRRFRRPEAKPATKGDSSYYSSSSYSSDEGDDEGASRCPEDVGHEEQAQAQVLREGEAAGAGGTRCQARRRAAVKAVRQGLRRQQRRASGSGIPRDSQGRAIEPDRGEGQGRDTSDRPREAPEKGEDTRSRRSQSGQ